MLNGSCLKTGLMKKSTLTQKKSSVRHVPQVLTVKIFLNFLISIEFQKNSQK